MPDISPSQISLCRSCWCMTKTIDGHCGKCKELKDTSTQQDKELQQIFLPIALKSGTVREDGSHTEDFDDWDTLISQAIEAIQARDKEIARKARLDELNRLIPNPVAEMASIDYKTELTRMFDDIRERREELSS
jgi:hypothetical protein